jgi:tripartite-type tricarboxylate transporter receptor subunit TctC
MTGTILRGIAQVRVSPGQRKDPSIVPLIPSGPDREIRVTAGSTRFSRRASIDQRPILARLPVQNNEPGRDHMTAITRRHTVALALGALASRPAFGQGEWPNRAVRIIVPFAAGGSADTLARIVGQKLSEAFGQQFVVENKGGAGGLLAGTETVNAAPDGYTLTVSSVGATIIAPAVNAKTTFHPLNDFTHIATFGGPPTALLVQNDLPVRTLDEFVAYVKTQAGKLTYGSPSPGSHGHLIGQLFSQKAGIAMTHVAYRGAALAIKDLTGGHISAASLTLTTAAGALQAKAVRPLALTAATRVPTYPDIPTYKELGYPDLVAVTWFGLSGPARMPPEIVKRINAEVLKAFKDPEIRARLAREAIDPEPFDPQAFTAYFKAEYERWTPIAKGAGVTQ